MANREENLTRLLLRIATGDAPAMQELFLQERSSLHRLFFGLARCASLADDLVQSTFLGLWQYRANYRGRGSAAAYLYRIAIHQWRRSLRREIRGKDSWADLSRDFEESTPDDASTDLERKETMQRIWIAIDDLPDEQREVFLLHRYHGLSCPEISTSTDVNIKTVESRLRLALIKLTRSLHTLEKRS